MRNQIPNLAFNDHIIDQIMKYTDLTKAEIIEHLKWGQGPTIEIIQLDNACGDCNNNVLGMFSLSTPNILYLDIDLINTMENSQSGTIMGDAFIFLVGTTLLHEYVHFGDNLDGSDYPGEEGELFERDAYGQNVTSNNMIKILLKN